MALWMLIISNGILWVEHYFHGQRSSINLFIAEEDACSSHSEETESCCEASCSCHHEDENGIPAPNSNPTYPAIAQALENCCFESSNWMQLEEIAKPDLELELNHQLSAILIIGLIFPDIIVNEQDIFLIDDPLPLSDTPLHLLHSVFLC